MYKVKGFRAGVKAFAFKKRAKATVCLTPSHSFSIVINGVPFESQFSDVFTQMSVLCVFEAVGSSNFVVIADT